MKTVQTKLIEESLLSCMNLVDSIDEGNATLEEQEEMRKIMECIQFHLSRYMLFPPVPLTIEKSPKDQGC